MKAYKKAAALIIIASAVMNSACTVVVGESRVPVITQKTPENTSSDYTSEEQITENSRNELKEAVSAVGFDGAKPETAAVQSEPEALLPETEAILDEPFTYTNYDPYYKDRLDGYFTDAQLDYIRSCVFVGDSTCLAFQFYGFISPERCYAQAGAAARNIYDWVFMQRKEEKDILTALADSGCKSFYFLMGLNDVNMTSAEDYYRNYRSFLEAVLEICPYADINLLSVTPVTEDCEFCFNSSLNSLNEKLTQIAKESGGKIKYIDIASFFKDGKGNMKPAYATKDGIHMREGGYYDILRIICQSAGV